MSMITAPRADPPEAISLWGEIYYRASIILAGVLALLAAGNFVYKASEGDPWVPIFPLMLAVVIWLIGRLVRFMLSARIN